MVVICTVVLYAVFLKTIDIQLEVGDSTVSNK